MTTRRRADAQDLATPNATASLLERLHIREFHIYWHRLLDVAAIPWEEHFGPHYIRKTLAMKLWENDPKRPNSSWNASLSSSITARRYVGQTGIVARAVDAIPQPSAFMAIA